MNAVEFPLNDAQISLLKLTERLSDSEISDLKKIIIAYKSQKLARLTDAIWEEKGWSQATMDAFLSAHLRTSYQV